MRVELLRTLKGSETWGKGMVFNDAISPIPSDIMLEVSQGARTVRVLSEPPKAIKVSDITPVITESFEVAEDMDEIERLVDLSLGQLNPFDPLESEVVDAPEEESPEAATEKIVAAETDNASFITKEIFPKHLPELEGLIHVKGTIAAAANLLGVSYQTILRWRKGTKPKPAMLKKIKREYKKLMRPKDDQDRVDDTASTGNKGAHDKP